VAWRIEPVTTVAGIDDILAIESASFTNPWTRGMYLSELEQEGRSFLYLARDDRGHAVGFCSFWRILDELHINNLAVEPDSRHRGVARALLARALGDGFHLGVRRATLEVRRSNIAAQQLYGTFGFSVAGVRREYYSSPVEDALILWCDRLGEG